MNIRRRFKQTRSLRERLLEEAQNLREEAALWATSRCGFEKGSADRSSSPYG
jgi:hypothetical protein